jgi:hypothetical protein
MAIELRERGAHFRGSVSYAERAQLVEPCRAVLVGQLGVDVHALAEDMEGFTFADAERVCNVAARSPARMPDRAR